MRVVAVGTATRKAGMVAHFLVRLDPRFASAYGPTSVKIHLMSSELGRTINSE